MTIHPMQIDHEWFQEWINEKGNEKSRMDLLKMELGPNVKCSCCGSSKVLHDELELVWDKTQ